MKRQVSVNAELLREACEIFKQEHRLLLKDHKILKEFLGLQNMKTKSIYSIMLNKLLKDYIESNKVIVEVKK